MRLTVPIRIHNVKQPREVVPYFKNQLINTKSMGIKKILISQHSFFMSPKVDINIRTTKKKVLNLYI